MLWQSYQVMTNLRETIERLAEKPGRARVVAGGTDLMIQMLERETQDDSLALLDISQIEEIRGITESGPYLLIGAATTIAELANSALVHTKANALAQGASWLGSPQIRRVATIGGNVVNAQPAGDASVPLVALGAEAHIVSPEGERDLLVEELFQGVGVSLVNPCWEIVSHFRIPICEAPRRSSAMQRLATRKAFTLPQLSVAVWLEMEEGGDRFHQVRISAAPVEPTPWRARRAEESLANLPPTSENIKRAAQLARQDANPRDSLRGSAKYRKEMVEVLTRRALIDALSNLNKVLYD